MPNHAEQLAQELNLNVKNVQGAIELIDQGNTIPFIARYRKEATGSMDDQVLRDLGDRLEYLRGLDKRKDRGARARRTGRVSGLGDSDGPYVTTRSRATTRQLGRGGLPPSLAPLVHNDSRQSVGAGHARPAALLCCPSTG